MVRPSPRILWIVLSTLLFATASSAVIGAQPPLSLDERAAALRAIEVERQSHREWPDVNPASRPRVDESVPEGFFEARALDTVRKSRALERFWGHVITGAQLQAEIDRMARSSRRPARLAELWAAVGNDPYRVAEAMARPLLAERLLREWYAHDDRFHGAVEARARRQLSTVVAPDGLRATSGAVAERELTAERASGSRSVDPEAWRVRLEQIAGRFGARIEDLQPGFVSGLREEASRFIALGVVSRSDETLGVVTVEWPKRSFDSWWAEVSRDLPTTLDSLDDRFSLPELGTEPCVDDTWRPTQAIPDPRYEHTAVWTGAEMIVWGGMSSVGNYPERGGRYDPATDTWTLVSQVGEPGLRAEHTAVWTGTEMVVWGGFGEDSGNTGGRYDPLTDAWRPTTTAGAPSARSSHVAVWTGGEMIVWGGFPNVSTGGRYDPVSDSWRPTTTAGAPQGRSIASVVWTGTEMIVWGGFADPFTLDTGGRYNPATDSWRATSLVNVPSYRHFHTAVWTGEEMIVWGGVGVGFGTRTGGRYDPATDTWQATSTAGAPSARWLQDAVWTGDRMVIWGGTVLLAPHPTTGGLYDPSTDTWQPTNTANAPEGREDAASVWTGSEMIVWGGLGDETFVNTGGRYDPARDAWLPTQTYNVPTARGLHTAAWTGAEMLIYGSNLIGEDGGLYDPATDSWRAASTVDAPLSIQNMTSVWTGSEVIVWGGFPETDEGGRYDPLTDTWTPTSVVGTPGERYWHSAVWTGAEMIVWGGWPNVNTGGRYDPASDSWRPTTTLGAPSQRDSHAAVWTGTEMIVWGGYPEVAVGQSGGRYDPATDSWTATREFGAPHRRSNASAVWTGTEMIVWGGNSYQDFESYNSGGRYDPVADSWQATDTSGAPSPRTTPAVWTGDEMIVWGGDLQVGDGGRYNPLGDNWEPTTLVGAPTGRWNTTLVWTGEEAIAWGGIIETATGGLYCARLEGNLAPIARPDDYQTGMEEPLIVPPPGVLANDTDGNGDPLRARVVSGPSNGQLRFRSDGSFAYLPDAGFAGTDEFTYRAWDGEAPSPVETVSITVGCSANCLRSVLIVIDLLLESTRSRIWVETETGAPAAGAEVFATWTLPNGSQGSQSGLTDGSGQATLEIPDDSFGTFKIEIDDIVKEGFTFDPANSVLSHAKTR